MAVSTNEDKDKFTEALGNYESLLRENPDYPARPAIYQKLLTAAQKAGDTNAAARYEAEISNLTTPAPVSK